MIGIIAAVTQNGVIGVENKLPFDYPEDMKHFRTTTANSTIIMGRKTFEGIGKPLPKRRNIVISRTKVDVPGVETFPSISAAGDAGAFHALEVQFTNEKTGEVKIIPQPNTWFIGGASIYEEGMQHAHKIVLTLTPDVELRTPAIKFPWINPMKFSLDSVMPLSEGSVLRLATYTAVSV
jgi:dihydrofolate reductase